jgi:hypothetical protein
VILWSLSAAVTRATSTSTVASFAI